MAHERTREIKYYLALDLGSESMAAYYEDRRTGVGGMVSLQEYGDKLLAADSPPELLLDGGKPSPRLRTRIGLEDGRQPADLPSDHAILDFVDEAGNRLSGYEETLFSYFYLPDQEFSRTILPNPKIPFQEGGAGIIPEVETSGHGKTRHSPESLLAHLTVQVVRNLVLRSPELRKVLPEEIHLVLTVPNVYSLVHVKGLMDFVRQHVTVGRLDYLYESDAVAYLFIEAPKGGNSSAVEEFKKNILNRGRQDLLRIATIDVGRGTTDLSLVQITAPAMSAGQRQHFVLARTGKSDGGSRLSYLLAEFYNDIVRRIFAEHQIDLPFDFLKSRGSVGFSQAPALQALETLIESIKRNLQHNYRLSLPREAQLSLIDSVVNRLLAGVDPLWGTEEDPAVQGLPELRESLRQALLLPKKLRRSYRSWFISIGFVQTCLRFFQGGGALAYQSRLMKLADALEEYVDRNVVQLIDQLKDMARSREGSSHTTPSPRKVFERQCTFVVIAGQGSQFAPIAKAIREYFANEGLPIENLHFLRGADAKEACCRGAVQFIRAKVSLMNEEELHGVYGFLNAAPLGKGDAFRQADMSQIRSGGECTVTFPASSEFYLIFSPRFELGNGRPPQMHDGTTAIIRSFDGANFTLRYNPENLSLSVNGDAVRVLPTFGSINESIYPKIWPEVLQPASDS
jgi:hypothetical protein